MLCINDIVASRLRMFFCALSVGLVAMLPSPTVRDNLVLRTLFVYFDTSKRTTSPGDRDFCIFFHFGVGLLGEIRVIGLEQLPERELRKKRHLLSVFIFILINFAPMNKQLPPMKKFCTAFISIVILCFGTDTANASDPHECYQKGLFALDLSVGTNIDLSSLNPEQKTVFDERPKAAFQISIRPSYYFSRHWGAYTDLRLNFFRLNNKEILLDILMPGLGLLKPAMNLGGTYRFEQGLWQIQPRLGVGILNYGNRDSKVNVNGKETHQKRSGGMWCVDAGVSAAYRTSRVCSIFLDISAMLPFTPAKYSTTTTIDGVITGYQAESYSWGRSMSISLGIRLRTTTIIRTTL